LRQVLRAADPAGRIYLFGSRTDDARKGGDIDVFLEASCDLNLKARLALESRLTGLCGTKVDLLVKSPACQEMPIFEIARRGVPL
jgi:predicted nucleotidyltransferase